MTTINPHPTTNAQLRNWDNFCNYHATGDWYGIWTRYFSNGEIIESLKCVRSLRASVDSNEINHQNHYIYANGKTELKVFGPYKKPITRSLFLDNSFSWGLTTVEFGSPFAFETGFRYKDRRASAAVTYNNNGMLQNITIIPEHLASFVEQPPKLQAFNENNNWEGTLQTMTVDLVVSSAVATVWKRLEELGKNYLTLHFSDGISVSVPRQIENEKEFYLAVDWQVNSALLQRGIRHFGKSGFTNFTLEIFTLAL